LFIDADGDPDADPGYQNYVDPDPDPQHCCYQESVSLIRSREWFCHNLVGKFLCYQLEGRDLLPREGEEGRNPVTKMRELEKETML
jgi:hypothetical protein